MLNIWSLWLGTFLVFANAFTDAQRAASRQGELKFADGLLF